MQFDFISDLHVDQWDTETRVNWKKTKQSEICVVAGDISDNITQSVEELKDLADIYEHVFFIEGNHEHQHYWPNFDFAPNYFKKSLTAIPNIHYLYDTYYILNGVAFVGKCGWWDFKFAEPLVPEEVGRKIFIRDKYDMCDEIAKQSDSEFQYLFDKVISFQFNDEVEKIVMVTHTAPLPKFISPNEYPPWIEYSAFQGNINMPLIIDADFKKKIKAWIFGHNHDQKQDHYKGVQFVSNPRGRPTDYNRIKYTQRTMDV